MSDVDELEFNEDRNDDEVEENSNKKRKTIHQSNEQVQVFLPPIDEPMNEFYIKSVNVTLLRNVLTGFSSSEKTTNLIITLKPEGFQIRTPFTGTPDYIISYFNKSLCTDYIVRRSSEYIFEKPRIKQLIKFLKDSVFFEMSPVHTDEFTEAGIRFRGTVKQKNGKYDTFEFYLHDQVVEKGVFNEKQFVFEDHVFTPSEQFANNIGLITKDAKYVSITIKENVIAFGGVSEVGFFTEEIKQQIDAYTNINQSLLLDLNALKPVTSATSLNQTLKISFVKQNPDIQYVTPVLFEYILDNNAPQSHYSFYIIPCPRKDDDE